VDPPMVDHVTRSSYAGGYKATAVGLTHHATFLPLLGSVGCGSNCSSPTGCIWVGLNRLETVKFYARMYVAPVHGFRIQRVSQSLFSPLRAATL
jgi:hypothetical protein